MQLDDVWLDRFRLFYLVGSLESDLRAIIREWAEPWLSPENLFGERLPTLETRRTQDGVDSSHSLVNYLDFSDSFTLINRHHTMVPGEIASALKAFTQQLEPLVQPRNRVMHMRVLMEGDLDGVKGVCTEFLNTGLELPELRVAVRRLQMDPNWQPEIVRAKPWIIPNNLPLPEFDETGLVGRQSEAEKLREMLTSRRQSVVTLVGEGGIGKSALAIKVLDDIVNDSQSPFGVVLWTSLKHERLTGTGVEEIADSARGLLDDLDVWLEVVGESEDATLQALAAVLEGLNALVVIDNLETTTGAEAFKLIDALPRDTTFLVTSRVGLGQLERRQSVGPLDSTDCAKLLRAYARARGVEMLSKLPQETLRSQAEKLRRNPLAVRWYVEAVELGGSPDDLLGNQNDVIRFSLEAIYEGLTELERSVLAVLHVSEDELDVPSVSLLSKIEPDKTRKALLQLARRSLVHTVLRGDDGTLEFFTVASSAKLYLTGIAAPSDEFARDVQERERKLQETNRELAEMERSSPLNPKYLSNNDVHRGSAMQITLALNAPRSNFDQALEYLDKALTLDPTYVECHRVRAFICSNKRPKAATASYRRALELAATQTEARARVAYFFSHHLVVQENRLDEAAAMATEAHAYFDLPVTATRLGWIETRRNNWGDAERLLRIGVGDENVKAAMMARTSLLNLAKRRLEFVAEEERNPIGGIKEAAPALENSEAYLATDRFDERLVAKQVELAVEIVTTASHLADVGEVETELLSSLSLLERRIANLLTTTKINHTKRCLYRLLDDQKEQQLPEHVRLDARRLVHSLREVDGAEFTTGTVKVFKKHESGLFGFIKAAGSKEVFFHPSAIPDRCDQIQLIPGAGVEYQEMEDAGKKRKASLVRLAGGVDRLSLTRRRSRIVERKDKLLICEDDYTSLTILVHRDAFSSPNGFESAEVGDLVICSYELTEKGPRASENSAKILAE